MSGNYQDKNFISWSAFDRLGCGLQEVNILITPIIIVISVSFLIPIYQDLTDLTKV